MSFLRDFGAAFASNIGAEMYQREEDARRIKLEEELEKRRFARRHNMKAKVAVPESVPVGEPYQDENGRWVVDTQVARRALLNETTGDVEREAGWERGQPMAAKAPDLIRVKAGETLYDAAGNELFTGKPAPMNEYQRERIKVLREKGGGGGSATPRDADGLTPYQRKQFELAERREDRLSNQKSSGGMTEKGWREGLDATLTSIQDADPGKLKSMIRQYGGDNVLTGDMDEDMLRETAFSVAETYWNERKPSNKAKADDKPETVAYDKAAAEVKARRPDLSDADVRAYLATKGIRP